MDYVLGGYYRENNTRTLVFPRPTNVPDDAVAQLHIDVGADVVAYVMATETIDGDVFDSFTALSGLTEYVGGWRASIKYVASNGDIWASGNFELNIKERVDGDEAIISANPDVLEALQATALDHEARIAAIEASSGTGSHNSLSGRDAEDAHPISAITGLQDALSRKQGTLTAGDNITIVEDVISATGALSETDPIFTAWLDTDPIPDSPSEVGAEPANANIQSHISSTSNPHLVTKSQVGLGSVDNTSDLNKPISTATASALSGKSDTSHLHTGTYEPASANIQSHISSTSNPHATTASQVGAEPDGAVAEHNVSGTAHADLRPVYYSPATMTVNAGTLNAGAVGDLAAVGGTDVSIQEASGTDPITVTFTFTGVDRFDNVRMYLDYIGGASHVIACEIYNPTTLAWVELGQFGTTTIKKWYDFPSFTPNDYLDDGAVSVRLRHLGTGIITHELIIDYFDINDGGASGSNFIMASTVGFTPSGNLAATNVAAALIELDSEKQPAGAYLTTFLGAPDVFVGTQSEWDALTPEQRALTPVKIIMEV